LYGNLLAFALLNGEIGILDTQTKNFIGIINNGHLKGARIGSFSSNGKFLSTGSFDKTAKVWKIDNIRSTSMPSHDFTINGVKFSPDGKWIATGGWDSKVILWNFYSGHSTLFRGHSEAIREVAFSPDGKYVATGSNDFTARIWDVQTGQVIHILTGHTNHVWGISFNPDGNLLATGSYDGTIRVWDVKKGNLIRILEPREGIRCVIFSPDGKYLATGVDDGLILWDTSTWKKAGFFPVHRLNRSTIIDFSHDGKLVASGSADGGLKIWEVKSEKLWKYIGKETSAVDGLAFSPDGNFIASTHPDEGLIRIWDVKTGLLSISIKSGGREPYGIDFSPDGKYLAVGNSTGAVYVYDLENERLWWRAPLLLTNPVPILITHKGLIGLIEGEKGNILRIEEQEPRLRDPLREAEKSARKCRVTEDEKFMTLRTIKDRLEYWDLSKGIRIFGKEIPGLEDEIPFSNGFVTLSNGKVSLWRCESLRIGQCSEKILVDSGIAAIGNGNDGIVLGSEKEISYFSIDGELKKTFEGKTGISAITMIGKNLVVGFLDGSIEIRNIDRAGTTQELNLEGTFGSPVTTIREGPSKTIVAGYSNGFIGIWNIRDGKRLYYHKLHGPVIHLKLSEKKLYAATEIGDFFVHDLSMFYLSYCELLQDIWQNVKVVWKDGKILESTHEPEHLCRK